MPPRNGDRFWKYARGLALPVLLLAVLLGAFVYAYALYLGAYVGQKSDEENLIEWVEQSRPFRQTLPELVTEYMHLAPSDSPRPADPEVRRLKAEEIGEHLKSLGEPLKMYERQLPLFAKIYRLELEFADRRLEPIVWDSEWPRARTQISELVHPLAQGAQLRIEYKLHAFHRQQLEETSRRTLVRQLGLLGVTVAIPTALYVYWFVRRERAREMQRIQVRQQLDEAERLRLQEELRRREAEHRQEEIERKLLEQRFATQEAEQNTLEMKSQLYASIGIMAGSYAHNIKNLLVRPNDLLRRCMEGNGLGTDREHMLQEVRQTLDTVTDRLQQILKTVRRDPTRAELARVDLNEIVREIHGAWHEMALQKWKLVLRVEPLSDPAWIDGDRSHLIQAVENLVFNARDATFEMRGLFRDQARRDVSLAEEEKRQALIGAASWKGSVVLRTRKPDDAAILEVEDNGIGMTEEVRRRCVETHFSTKRDNAVYEGNTTGMGLGLSFVQAVLEHHRARMEIISTPERGATFRLHFPTTRHLQD